MTASRQITLMLVNTAVCIAVALHTTATQGPGWLLFIAALGALLTALGALSIAANTYADR